MLLKNGKVYIDKCFTKKDILLKDGIISEIADEISDYKGKIFDAQGKFVMPGFVDFHTHLRDPGQTYKEDIVTGSLAAAKGGYTTICAMPNTEPVVDNIAIVDYIKRKAKDLGYCNVQVIGALTKKSEGKEISEIANMLESGIVAVSDDGRCVQNAKLMMNAMKYVSYFDLPIVIHAEDYNLAGNGQINAGRMSTKLGLSGIPALAEEIIIARDIRLAQNLKCRLHIAHISTEGSIELLRKAKASGMQITAEVTPHHLTLTEEACSTFDTNTKVKPPLRTNKDRNACLNALIDGTIDFIATDHAPHSDFEKEKEFNLAPYGINGLETAFASLYTELVLSNQLELTVLVEKLSTAPSEFLRLNSGMIETGKNADLTIVDLDADVTFTRENMKSKSCNTPYLNKTLKGKIVKTICGGRVTWSL